MQSYCLHYAVRVCQSTWL